MYLLSFIIVLITAGNVWAESCQTPNKEDGQCLPIFSCDSLYKRIKKNMTAEEIAFLKSFSCGFSGRTPKVCCPTKSIPKPEPVYCNKTISPPEQSSKCCGESVEYRFISGNITFIDLYPWMALIEHKKDNETVFKCSGVLISSKYVLTAAHCVAEEKLGKPSSIRVGEFDLSHEGLDCAELTGGGIDCTEGSVSILIERIIVHEQYDAKTMANDIALIELKDFAPFTDFVKPICLPKSNPLSERPEHFNLQISGWASRDDSIPKITKKQHNNVPIIDMEQCQTALNNTKLINGQICAGDKDRNTCRSEYGGPLMWSNNRFYQVIGILSFGPTPCHTDKPSVFTNVFEYMDWINKQTTMA